MLWSVLYSRNKAIADYLRSNGYVKALAEFQKEADMVSCKMRNGKYLVMISRDQF